MSSHDVGGSRGLALERWQGAAQRLGLDPVAAECGALLLASELDLELSARLLGEHAQRVAVRRVDIVRALEPKLGRDAVLAALAGLEARGVVTPFPAYAGPWLLAELELARPVRLFCMGATRRASAASAYSALPRVAELLERTMRSCRARPQAHLIVIRGQRGSGRDALLAELLRLLGVEPLQKTVFELRQTADPLEPELSGAAPVWDARRADIAPEDYDVARRWLGRSTTVSVALLDPHHDCPDVDGRLALQLSADPRTLGERLFGWNAALERAGVTHPDVLAAARRLAERTRAGQGFAERAVAAAGLEAAATADYAVTRLEEELHALIQPSTLRGIAVERSEVPLSRVIAAERVTSALERLILLCSSYVAVPTPGRYGVKALFFGPSGTGKTLAARAIACSVGRVLFRVDLASVVSKWIGETERNLRDAMAAAEAAGAVLLFDEGDALFGKRGEVSKGTDRYANMEVSYLLQAIEAYEGIAIVTTNLRSNVDQAFERRFDTSVDFSLPESDERAAIWRQELGEAGSELSPAFVSQVARQAELSGGSIASAARFARVIAAGRGASCALSEDVQLAVHAEFLKLGSTVRAHNWSRAPTRRS
ncbi:MAG TPA: ATP-binding protein [Polyangiaceae bacterium]